MVKDVYLQFGHGLWLWRNQWDSNGMASWTHTFSSGFVSAHVLTHPLCLSLHAVCTVGVDVDHPRVKGWVARGPGVCKSVFHEATGCLAGFYGREGPEPRPLLHFSTNTAICSPDEWGLRGCSHIIFLSFSQRSRLPPSSVTPIWGIPALFSCCHMAPCVIYSPTQQSWELMQHDWHSHAQAGTSCRLLSPWKPCVHKAPRIFLSFQGLRNSIWRDQGEGMLKEKEGDC